MEYVEIGSLFLPTPPTAWEDIGNEDCCDSAGYIPKEEQLRLLAEAGESLEEYYRHLYPGNPNQYEDDPDEGPTLGKYADELDVIDTMRSAMSRLSAQEKTARQEELRSGGTEPAHDVPQTASTGNVIASSETNGT